MGIKKNSAGFVRKSGGAGGFIGPGVPIDGGTGGGGGGTGDPGADSPVGRGEHPRFLITETERPSIVAALGTGGGLNSTAQSWLTWLDGQMASLTAAQMFAAKTSMRPYYVFNVALAYILSGGDTWDGTAAVSQSAVPGLTFSYTPAQYATRVRDLLALFEATSTSSMGAESGQCFVTGYDWCYAALSASEREAFANWAATYNPTGTSVDNRGDAGDVHARAMAVTLALAIKNDGYQSAWVTTYDKFSTWWRGSDGVTTGNAGGQGTGGGYIQGLFYGIAYNGGPCLLMEEYARTALGLSATDHYTTGDADAWRYLPRYLYRCLTGDAMPRSTTTSAKAVPRTNGYQYYFYNGELEAWAPPAGGNGVGPAEDSSIPSMLWAASVLQTADSQQAQLAKWMLENRSGYPGTASGDWQYGSAMWRLVIGHKVPSTTTPSSPADCGEALSVSSPEGRWVFRTNLSAASIDHPTIMVLAQRWAAGSYGFRHCGDLHIYRKGPQMVRHGINQGHDNISAWQSSVMLFPKWNATRTELTGSVSGDTVTNHDAIGAERLTTSAVGTAISTFYGVGGANDCQQTAPKEFFTDGSRLVDYLGLDLLKAYSDYSSRLTAYWRHIVYFRPSSPTSDSVRIVVFDRSTLQSPYDHGGGTGTYGRTLKWVTAGEPTFANGSSSAGPNRGPTGTGGKTYSDDCTLVTAVNTANGANGKTWISVLLPSSSRRIIKCGGPASGGQHFYFNSNTGVASSLWSHELDTPFGYHCGTSYGSSDPASYRECAGEWHIQIEDRSTNATNPFLTAIEVSDSSASQSTTEAITGTGFSGARIGSGIALFGTTSDSLTSGDFTIPTAGTYNVLISCIQANRVCTLTGTGATVTGTLTASAAGTLYLTITTTGANTVMTLG